MVTIAPLMFVYLSSADDDKLGEVPLTPGSMHTYAPVEIWYSQPI